MKRSFYFFLCFALLLVHGHSFAREEVEYDCINNQANFTSDEIQFLEDLEKVSEHVEEKTYKDFFLNPLLDYLIEIRKNQSSVFQGVDSKLSGLRDEKYNIRVDLLMADTIDQLSLLLEKKKWKKYKEEIYNVLADKPLENFFSLIIKLKELAAQDSKFKQALDKIHWQEYDLSGRAVITTPKIFKKGGLSLIKRMAKIGRYNQVQQDSESENILRTIAKTNIAPFISSRSTVTKLMKMKKSQIKTIKNTNEKEYTRLLEQVNQQDEVKYTKFGNLKFNNKKKFLKQARVKVKGKASKSLRNDTVVLYNALDGHPQKQQMYQYINKHMEEREKIQSYTDNKNQKHLIMSPTYLHHHKDKIEKLIKEFSYDQLIGEEDDDVLYAFRKWVKKNREKVKDAGITLRTEKGMPSRSDIIESYDEFLLKLPSRPWEGKMIMKDAKGNPVVLGQGRVRRALGRVGRKLKDITKIENLARIAVGAGAMSMTGNPYIATVGGSVTRDVVYAHKHGHDISETLKTKTPKNAVRAVILATGFASGELAHSAFTGAISGTSQAYFTGRPILTSTVVGAGFGVLDHSFANKVLKAKVGDSNLKSGLREITRTSIKSSSRGAIVAYLDDGDYIQGAKEGAVYGAGEAGLKIITMGFEYDPRDHVNQTDIDDYYKEHNELVSSEAYQGKSIQMDKKMFDKMTFRKDSVVRKVLGLEDRSFHLAGNASMVEKDIYNTETLVHESTHYAQELHYGAASFWAKYLSAGNSHGNIYEDYSNIYH